MVSQQTPEIPFVAVWCGSDATSSLTQLSLKSALERNKNWNFAVHREGISICLQLLHPGLEKKRKVISKDRTSRGHFWQASMKLLTSMSDLVWS